jgi:hypothetical protein
MAPKRRKISSFSRKAVDVTLGGVVVDVSEHQLRCIKPDYAKDDRYTSYFREEHFLAGTASQWTQGMIDAVLLLIVDAGDDERIVAAFAKVHSAEFGTNLGASLEALGPFFNSLPRTDGSYTHESITAYLKRPQESEPFSDDDAAAAPSAAPAPSLSTTPLKAASKEAGFTPDGYVNLVRMRPEAADFVGDLAALLNANKKAGARATEPYVGRLSLKSQGRVDTIVDRLFPLITREATASYMSSRLLLDASFRSGFDFVYMLNNVLGRDTKLSETIRANDNIQRQLMNQKHFKLEFTAHDMLKLRFHLKHCSMDGAVTCRSGSMDFFQRPFQRGSRMVI